MAMLGAVGGALLTGSISYISQSKLQKNLEQKEAFQREQAASQAQAELEKVRAQANAAAVEAARTRLANHAAAVKQQIEKLNGKYWTVRLFNGTGTYVSVAVNYVALDGLSETTGWTTFQQGQWLEVLKSRERNFWYFVVPGNPNCHWQPANAVPVTMPVSREDWRQPAGELLSESQTVITSSIRLAYTLRSGQRRISRFPVTEHGSQWCIHLFLCHDHLATRAWMIECRPRSPHWHCGRARETLPAEIRRARNGVKVQRANARSTLGFCWLRAAQCAHRRSHWFVYWVVGDSEVGSHLPPMTPALSASGELSSGACTSCRC